MMHPRDRGIYSVGPRGVFLWSFRAGVVQINTDFNSYHQWNQFTPINRLPRGQVLKVGTGNVGGVTNEGEVSVGDEGTANLYTY